MRSTLKPPVIDESRGESDTAANTLISLSLNFSSFVYFKEQFRDFVGFKAIFYPSIGVRRGCEG